MALQKIPDRGQNLLCASFHVNSFKRAIEELVYNSLDAESTSIAIRVCIERKYIQVLDNGVGIAKDNFRLLGDKYVTSKFININLLKSRPKRYGFKGISLASIIQISESVKISSKIQNSQETWTKAFSKGRTEEFYLTTLRPSKGTTVELFGFLYNLNIQSKSIDVLKEINNIKLFLEHLSLVHCNVSLSLRDDSKNEIIFKIHKNRNIYQTLWSLFQINRNDVQDLQVEKNEYKVKAYISKNCLLSKKYQWIYLNGRDVYKTFLHKKINECFAKKLSIRTNKLKNKFTGEINFVCTIPSYFIFISCPNFDFDINYNKKQTIVEFKNCDEINKLIEKLVNFYCGDVNVKPMNVREVNNKNGTDTRKKVKELMDKILNKNNIKDITELRNGRKGKNIKRKNEKNVNNILQKTEKKSKEKNNKTKQSINITNKKREHVYNTQNNKKLEIIYSSIKNKRKQQKSKKHYKTDKATLKTYVYDEPLLKKFKEQTKTVKKRCQILSDEVQNLFNKTYFYNKMYEFNKNKKNNFQSNNRVDKINNQFLSHSETEKPSLFKKQMHIVNKNSNIQFKTSYDLLKTSTDNEMSQIKAFSKVSCEKIIPRFTFNSHKRTFPLNKRTIHRFCNRKSNINLNKICEDINHCYRKYINKTAILKECSDRQESLKDICNESNRNVLSQRNSICDSDKIDNVKNRNIYSNYDNTYTIDILNSFRSSNDNVNKTYTVKMATNLSYSNNISETSSSIKDTIKSIASRKGWNSFENVNSVFISESQTIEPLVYCEAILGGNELLGIEGEFNISFVENEERDICLKTVDNITGEIEEKSQYFYNANIKNDDNQQEELVPNTVQEGIPSNELLKKLTLDPNYLSLEALNNETNNTDYFKIHSRHIFLPKGMSPIFKKKFHKNAGTCSIHQEYFDDIIYKEFADDVRDKFKIFEPDAKNVKDTVSRDLNKVNDRIGKDNENLIFDAQSLKHAKILGQLDRKFIAAKIHSKWSQYENSSEFLTLFDQHAVDERVRLERNLSDYFDGIKWKSAQLDAFTLKLSQEDCFYLYNYKNKFYQFGLKWTFADNGVLIHAVPKAMLGKNPRKPEVIFTAVKMLISEQIEIIKTIRGNVPLHPKSIMELVFSEACRFAIKFGDFVSKTECVNMISALASCKTPFQCAHGRPVMAVIMELPNHNDSYKIILEKIKTFKNEYCNKVE